MYIQVPTVSKLFDITGKASTDARSDRAESQFMLNKSNPSLLRSDMSENKDTIHRVLHVTKSFAVKEPEFWNCTELRHPEFLSEYPTH